MVPRARSEGGHVSHVSNEFFQQFAARMAPPIVIDDDDDEVQEIPRPAQRRSTQTPGMFVTPHPSEVVGTSSNGRQTVDLTAEPEPGPLDRYRSRGTTDSGGLFVRQSHSEPNSSTAPASRGVSVQVDLTLCDDEEETDGHGKTAHDDAYQKKEDGGDKKASHTPLVMEESRGVKRPRSSSTAVNEPANSAKRQMDDAHFIPQSR